MTDVLQAAGPLDGRIMLDAANSLERGVFGQQRLSLRSLAGAFPRARWARAFNSLSVGVMVGDNHRKPPWVLFLSGDEQAKGGRRPADPGRRIRPGRPGRHRRQPAAGPRQRAGAGHGEESARSAMMRTTVHGLNTVIRRQ